MAILQSYLHTITYDFYNSAMDMIAMVTNLLPISSTPTLLVAFTAGVIMFALLNASIWKHSARKIPPYPALPLPFFGNLLSLKSNPRGKLIEWREKCGDIFSLKLGGKHVIVLNGYDVLKEVLVKNADLVTVRPKTLLSVLLNERNKGIINASGENWKEQRKAALSILKTFGMGKNIMASKIEHQVSVYIEKLASLKGNPQDVRVLTGVSISNVICSIVIGKTFEHEDPFFRKMVKIISEIVTQIGGTALLNHLPVLRHLPGDIFHARKLQKNVADIGDIFLCPIIAEHKESFDSSKEPHDFIDAYMKEMNIKHEKRLTTTLDEENLAAIIKNIFAAGTETTSSTIMWCMLYLLHHPLEQEKVYQEIVAKVGTDRRPNIGDKAKLNYLNAVIMETQRRASIAPLSFQRLVSSDIEVRGYTLPAESIIMPSLDSVLWDEKLWGDPWKFRPSRFLDDQGSLQIPEYFTPFSMGRRICLGEGLAKMELFLYLSSILQRFRVAPAGDGPLPSTRAKFGITCAPEEYKLRLIERKKL